MQNQCKLLTYTFFYDIITKTKNIIRNITAQVKQKSVKTKD